MKFLLLTFALGSCLFLPGCSQPEQPVSAPPTQVSSQPAALTPQQELAKYCRVCVVDNGEKMEEYLPTRLDTKNGGNTYRFCKDDCQKKFKANPAKYKIE